MLLTSFSPSVNENQSEGIYPGVMTSGACFVLLYNVHVITDCDGAAFLVLSLCLSRYPFFLSYVFISNPCQTQTLSILHYPTLDSLPFCVIFVKAMLTQLYKRIMTVFKRHQLLANYE